MDKNRAKKNVKLMKMSLGEMQLVFSGWEEVDKA
jgi:hypothetical protein